MEYSDLQGMMPSTPDEKELLDYLAAGIVARLNSLPVGFKRLFRPGTFYRQPLNGVAADSRYYPLVDFMPTETGLHLRFSKASGETVATFFFAWGEGAESDPQT